MSAYPEVHVEPPTAVAGLLSVPRPTQIREGISSSALVELAGVLELNDSDLERLMHISRQTLSRRKRGDHKLTPLETDRLAMLGRVYNAALSYYDGDREAAVTWLKHPAPALGEETPLEHCDTTPGAEAVLELLGRLEHGIAA